MLLCSASPSTVWVTDYYYLPPNRTYSFSWQCQRLQHGGFYPKQFYSFDHIRVIIQDSSDIGKSVPISSLLIILGGLNWQKKVRTEDRTTAAAAAMTSSSTTLANQLLSKTRIQTLRHAAARHAVRVRRTAYCVRYVRLDWLRRELLGCKLLLS